VDPDANAPLPPQTTVGGSQGTSYELLGRLAVGGMAELYLARTTGADGRDTVVVLKRILPHLAEDPEFVRMFRDEAYLAATLQHPNIVRVYEIGRHGEDWFFTMEYVHGENLRAILRAAQKRNESIPLQHVLTIALGVTSALHYAHEQRDQHGNPLKIVHRDVSPTNVLVSYDGNIKILDFGIAKAAAGTHVTQAGMLKGKASYMSPEQCRAEPVDRRSDVFAIGILMYEMTTLTRLFRGDNELAILHQVLTGHVPPPSTRTERYPGDLERIVMRTLQNDPTQRYQTAFELQVELEQFARANGITPSTVGLAQYIYALFGGKPLPWAQGMVEPAPSESASGLITSAVSAGFEASEQTEQTQHRESRTPPPGSLDAATAGERSPSTPGRRARSAPRSGGVAPALRPAPGARGDGGAVRAGTSARAGTGSVAARGLGAARPESRPKPAVKVSAPPPEVETPPPSASKPAAPPSKLPSATKTVAPLAKPGLGSRGPTMPASSTVPSKVRSPSVVVDPDAGSRTIAPQNFAGPSRSGATVSPTGPMSFAPPSSPPPAFPKSGGTVAPANVPARSGGTAPPIAPNDPGAYPSSGSTAPSSASESSRRKTEPPIDPSPAITGATVAPGQFMYTPPVPDLDPPSGVMHTQVAIEGLPQPMPITGTPPRGSGASPTGSRTAPPSGRSPSTRPPTGAANPGYQPPAPDYDPDEDAQTQVVGSSSPQELIAAMTKKAAESAAPVVPYTRAEQTVIAPAPTGPASARRTEFPSSGGTAPPARDKTEFAPQQAPFARPPAPAPTPAKADAPPPRDKTEMSHSLRGSESAPQQAPFARPPAPTPAKPDAPPPRDKTELSHSLPGSESAPQQAPFAARPRDKTEFAPQQAPFAARPRDKTEFAPQQAPFAARAPEPPRDKTVIAPAPTGPDDDDAQPAAEKTIIKPPPSRRDKTEFAPQQAPFAARQPELPRDKTVIAPQQAPFAARQTEYPPGYEPREVTQFAPAPTGPSALSNIPPAPPGPADSTLSPTDATPPDGIPIMPLQGGGPPPPPSAMPRRGNRDTVFELPARPAALGGPGLRGPGQVAAPRSGGPQPLSPDASLDLEDARTIPMRAEMFDPAPPQQGMTMVPGSMMAPAAGWVDPRVSGSGTAPMAMPQSAAPPKGKSPMLLIAVAAIVLLPAIGFGVWWFAFRGSPTPDTTAVVVSESADAKAEDVKADAKSEDVDPDDANADDGAEAAAEAGAVEAGAAEAGAAEGADEAGAAEGAAAEAGAAEGAAAEAGAAEGVAAEAGAAEGAAEAGAAEGAAEAGAAEGADDEGADAEGANDDSAAADDGTVEADTAVEDPPPPEDAKNPEPEISDKKGSSKKGTPTSSKKTSSTSTTPGGKKTASKTSGGKAGGGKAKKKGQTPFPGFGGAP
jgi:serine/threonine protein kinase